MSSLPLRCRPCGVPPLLPLLLLALLLALPAAGAADRFVSASRGSDANSGATPQQAWATLAHAASASVGLRDARVLLRQGDSFELPAPGAAGVVFSQLVGVTVGAYADGGEVARPRLVRTASPASGATVDSGGTQIVASGGTATNTAIDGGTLQLQLGAQVGLEIVGGQYGVAFEFNAPTRPDGSPFGNLSVADCSFFDVRGVDYDPGSSVWWGAAVALASAGAAGVVELTSVTLAHNLVAQSDTMWQPFVGWPGTNPCTIASFVADGNTCVGCSYNALFLDMMAVATVTRNVFLRDTPQKLFSAGTTDIIIGYLDARSSVTDNEITARGEAVGAPDGCGVDFETNSSGLLFARNYVSRAWGAGVMVFGNVPGANQGLRILNNTILRNSCGGSSSPDRGQIAFTNAGSSGVIAGNVFATCAGVPVFQDGSEPGLPLWAIAGNAIDGENATLSVALAPLVSAAPQPGGGVLVTASSPTLGTTLVFTTDGSRPERASPAFPSAGYALPPGFRATAVLVKAFFAEDAPAPPTGVLAVESESAGGILSPYSNASWGGAGA